MPEILNLDSLDPLHQDIAFEDPIKYDIHVSLVSGGILIAGSLNTKVKCKCGRCLANFDMELQNIAICHFHENATFEDLDIAPELREDILISLPMKFICNEDCPGIVIKKKKSKSDRQAEEELTKENDIWKDLEGLKL